MSEYLLSSAGLITRYLMQKEVWLGVAGLGMIMLPKLLEQLKPTRTDDYQNTFDKYLKKSKSEQYETWFPLNGPGYDEQNYTTITEPHSVILPYCIGVENERVPIPVTQPVKHELYKPCDYDPFVTQKIKEILDHMKKFGTGTAYNDILYVTRKAILHNCC